MKNFHERIMAADFGKLFKRWIIAVLCVTLLGGGVSAALLVPQIRETISAVQTIQQQGQWKHWERDFPQDGRNRREKFKSRFKVKDVLRASVTRPSAAAILSIGATALLLGLLVPAFWLMTAAWLYQAATLSGMSGPLWGVLGLWINVLAAVLFIILRGFFREKCPACGRWQDKKADYCTACGNALSRRCPACGASCPADDRFCSACGVELVIAEAKGGGNC